MLLLASAAIVVLALVVGGLVLVARRGRPSPPAYTWSPAAVDGGGFVTVLAPSTRRKGLWLAGSDVAGVFRSTDGGVTWTGASRGFEATDQRKVGAIEWDPFHAGRAWACVGTGGDAPSGGVVRTTDSGVTWTTVSTKVFCSGGPNSLTDVGTDHPRSTGRLLVADPDRKDRLWIGTLDAGVARSDDAGSTWAPGGLDGLPIRGMALDPEHPDTLYVAVRTTVPARGGLYRTVDAGDPHPSWEHLAGPTVGEEVTIVGRRLYLAAGPEGVWRADLGASSPSLVRVGTGSSGLPQSPATDVVTVSAPASGAADALLAGLDQHAPCAAGYCPTLFASIDGGTSWMPRPGAATGVHPQIGSPAGATWRQAEEPDTLLGGTDYVTSDVRVDPFAPSHVLMAGRSGIWRSTDDAANWFPVPTGLTVTFHGRPAVDDAEPGSVVVPTADWKLLGSEDDGATVTGEAFPADGHDVATAARRSGRTSTTTAPLYVGEGRASRAGRAADVLVEAAPGGPFRSTGFATAVGASGVLAVAARDVGGRRVVVASSRGKGVWRKVGDGAWTRAAVPAGGADDPAVLARTGTLAWAGDGTLYLADRGRGASTGVWRSTDAGASWSRLTSARMDIAIDPTAPHRLWLAGADEVWRVDDARSGPGPDGRLAGHAAHLAGARLAAVDPDGQVVVVTSQVVARTGEQGRHGEVFRSTDEGRTFRRVSGIEVSRGLVDPVALAIGPTGVLHIATFGFGWWVGRPTPSAR